MTDDAQLSQDLPTPLYHQIQLVLRERVEHGYYGRDGLLPSEQEISREFGVSRITVARAVNELAAPFDMSQPAISKHLKVLERAGLVTRSQDAQRRPCHLEPAPLREAEDWLQRYADAVEARFARMDDVLAELVAARAPRTPSASPTRTPSSNRKKKKESHR